MPDNTETDKFLLFNVKPIWKLTYPSKLLGPSETKTYVIYGVDRGSLDISRNWTKIHSVEQFNQGFVATPEDFTVTIAVKEHGEAFEALRRCGKSAMMFDIECDILRTTTDGADIDYNSEGSDTDDEIDEDPWMDGFEKFIGCMIQREGQTIDPGTFPVREFEISFLRHGLKEIQSDGTSLDFEEGDGTFPDLNVSNGKLEL